MLNPLKKGGKSKERGKKRLKLTNYEEKK